MRNNRTGSLRKRSTGGDRLVALQTAQHVAVDILSSETGVEALKRIVEAARALTGAQYGALGIARTDGVRGLQEFVTSGMSVEDEAKLGERPKGVGILGLLLGCTQPLVIDDLAAHPASVGFPPNHPPMARFLGVPIRARDKTIGSLYLTDKADGEQFTEQDAVAVSALGAHAAVAIHNMLLLARQRTLVGGLIAAQEEERRAVAFDLHDGLTQYVMAAHAHLESFKTARASGSAEKAERELAAGLKYLGEAVVESRRLANGLRTLALDDLGLAGALDQAIAEERSRAGWQRADFVHNIAGVRFDSSIETTLYRVAQEALTNARKHAETDRVEVMLLLDTGIRDARRSRLLRLEVRDWGRGFDVDSASNDPSRVGLHSMSERVKILGGEWRAISASESGTTILASLCVDAEGAGHEKGK